MSIRECCDMTTSEAAQHLGVSYNAARAQAARAGVKLLPMPKNWRDIIQDMKPAEARDFLADCLDRVETALEASDPAPANLTMHERRLWNLFSARRGQLVTHQQIVDAVYVEGDAPECDWNHSSVWVFRLRKKTDMTLRSVSGLGYICGDG